MQPDLQFLFHRHVAARLVAAEARKAAIACSKARSTARRLAEARNIDAICATWTLCGGNAQATGAALRARAEASAGDAAADALATGAVRVSRAVRVATEVRAQAAKDAYRAAKALFAEK